MSDQQQAASNRKVVFLLPPEWIRDDLTLWLVENEYEACCFEDPQLLSRVIKEQPGSFIYVNIERGPDKGEWVRVLLGLESLRREHGVRLGLIAESVDRQIIKQFYEAITIECGILSGFPSRENRREVANRIGRTLAEYKARGARRFVRARCEERGNATINVKRGTDYHRGAIRDISSAGLACTLPTLEGSLELRSSLSDVQLMLGTLRCSVDVTVAAVRGDSPRLFVLLYASRPSEATRKKLHTYIRDTIQWGFERSLQA